MAEQNYKGSLQEHLQTEAQRNPQGPCRPPKYREIGRTGDPHMPVHTILLTAVWKGRELRVEKSARKKQDAEKEAAKEMYEMILQGVPASSAPPCHSVAPSSQDGGNDNAKNELQEMVQKQSGHPVPRYDLVSQRGPSHQPVFRVKVNASWNGEELVEEGQGNKRKAADKNAAERLLLRIQGRRQPPLPPLSEDDVSSDAEELPTGAKNKLQEILQKRGYPLPTYDLTNKEGPSHEPTFTVTLTVRNRAGRVVYTKDASAPQLKEAEKLCAKLALPEIEDQLDAWSAMPPSPPPQPRVPSSPPCVETHWELDNILLRDLARFTSCSPEVLCQPGENDVMLCSISVEVKDDGCCVVAQGIGPTPSDAVQCGMANLLSGIRKLYPTAARTSS